jgi:Carboxypeptidase regulatory-like domain
MRFFSMKSGIRILSGLLAMAVLTALPAAFGQTLAGMVGEVTDQSGAVVANVTVTLSNPTTGVKFTTTTNAVGFYRFSEIPPGQGYVASFTAQGFTPLSVKDIYLTVATIRTQNAAIVVGTRQEEVQVTASNSEVTIDTTGATIGNTFDVDQLNQLPVQQRNDPLALFALQPGVTDSGAVTGSRVDQNDVTVDGLDVNDFATGGASQNNTGSGISTQLGTIVGHAPVDSVEEFKGDVAGSDASTGPGGGGQFQLVTKGGTNTFHGNLNEYHRDPSLVANSWFSNNSTPKVPRNHLIQNQFGGNIGGPIKRDKLFFFFDYNNDKVISGVVVQRTVPSPALRAGTVTYKTAAGGGATNSVNEAGIKGYDPQGIGVDTNFLTYIDKRFPASTNNDSGDGINSLGFNFNAPDNDYETNYVGRGDYNINDKMKFFAKFTIARENFVEAPNSFPGDPSTAPGIDRSYNFVIGHNWVIGSNKTNRVFLGDVVQKFATPITYNPTGSTAFTYSDGADQGLLSNPNIWPNTQARRVPIEVLGDDFAWTSGRHTWQFGGTFKDILAHDTNVADFNTTEIGLGGNVLGLCGPAAGACGGANPSLRPADVDPNNTIYWDEPFTFLLGRIGSISSDYNYNAKAQVLPQLTGDQRFYKYYQSQFYLMDSWKVLPSLTVSYGLTYQWFSVPYETRGLESTEPMTFNQYFQARVQQSTLGETGPDAVPLLSYVLGGKGNGSGAPPLYYPQYRNFAPHLGFNWNPGFDKKLVINAGAGVIYDRTVINALQFIQDGDSYLFQQTKGNVYGIHADPYDSLATDKRLDANNGITTVTLTPPATPTPPYQPFVDANGNPFGLQNGLEFNATIDPALQNPYSIQFNAGAQRQMPWDMVLKVDFVGKLGRKLLAQEDANQVLDFTDTVSGQKLSQAWSQMIVQTRQGVAPQNLTVQPWMENVVFPGTGVGAGYTSNTAFLASALSGLVNNGDFGDFVEAISGITPYNVGSAAQFSENTFYDSAAFSNYYGLLVTLQKNMSHGLHYDFNYTWSHSIDNLSFFANSEGDTGIGGIGLVCDVIRPRECRASSDFDVRQYITSDATYQLPFGKGRMFLGADSRLLDEFIGGWDLSGIGEWHSGYPWTANSNAFVASYSNDAPPIYIGNNKSLVTGHLTKLGGAAGGVSDFTNASAAANSFEGPIGFQIGQRNFFRGPGFFNADLGLAKNFPITAERVSLKFRADAFNALNHPNFEVPSENVFNGLDEDDYKQGSGFGQISYTVTPSGNSNNGARVLQLSLRLEF